MKVNDKEINYYMCNLMERDGAVIYSEGKFKTLQEARDECVWYRDTYGCVAYIIQEFYADGTYGLADANFYSEYSFQNTSLGMFKFNEET